MLCDQLLDGYSSGQIVGCQQQETRIIGASNHVWSGLSSSRMSRVVAWINLLKDINGRLTNDAIVAYTIATGQTQLLSGMDLCDCCCAGPIDDYWYKEAVIDGTTVDHDNGYYGGPSLRPASSTGFDCCNELKKMAREYMFYRIGIFVKHLLDLTSWSAQPMSGIYVSNKVINALNREYVFNRTTEETILNIEMLHSNLIPELFDPHYTYTPTPIDHPNIKYPGDVLSNSRYSVGCADTSELTSDLVVKVNSIMSVVRNLGEKLIAKCEKSDDSDFEKLIKGFTLGLEIAVFFICLSEGMSSNRFLHSKDIRYANMMYFKKYLKDNGDDNPANGWYLGGDLRSNTEKDNISLVAKLSPTAILVMGDLIDNLFTRNIGYGSSYLGAEMLRRLKCDISYPSVASFVLQESRFQFDVSRVAKSRLEQFKQARRLINDRNSDNCNCKCCG